MVTRPRRKSESVDQRRDAGTVPVFAMTANAFAEDVEKSRRAGMNAHISKPASAGELYKQMKNFSARYRGDGEPHPPQSLRSFVGAAGACYFPGLRWGIFMLQSQKRDVSNCSCIPDFCQRSRNSSRSDF